MEKLLEIFLSSFVKQGSLDVETHSGKTFKVGDETGPRLAIRFVGAGSERRLLLDPELALGELFMDGKLIVTRGRLYDLLELAQRNLDLVGNVGWMKVLYWGRMAIRRWQQRNKPGRARRNVAHHYDLDGRLYSLFLDSDRQYSCAYFEHEGQSLDDAQFAKKRHIAAKLLVEPSHKVLDIGCGWGGLALYLADFCGAEVTGITLSKEQLAAARGRLAERQLTEHVDFRLQDYREIGEHFDRIVSVGMLEHVGVGYLGAYFRKVSELLAKDGVALVHTIGRMGCPGTTCPWTDKYIFPGGYIPALSEVAAAIERSRLVITDIEILRLHYADTLKAWHDRFMARRQEAAALYDERFCRMWEYYLAGAETGFRLGDFVVFQFQLAHDVRTVPLTRDYIAERESELRKRDSIRADLRLAGE
jgi:cyclopropane-fatty-acyl-phospholipid synthase